MGRQVLRRMCVCGLLAVVPRTASAQTISDVLSFLLTNRSISTGDFVRDEQAAVATRDTISGFLVSELGTLPISASSGGFTYRLNPELGVSVRTSDSFGPFFVERSLTAGAGIVSVAFNYQSTAFDGIDGRELRDGTLVATAARLRGETLPFDVETLTLQLRTDTFTVVGNVGVTDRFDVAAALPLIRLDLSGTRIDTYRGTSLVQAAASGTSAGPGDLLVRAKYNVARSGASGVALGVEARLPTGSEENLLGTGEATIAPRFIASWESGRAGVHANVGSSFGGRSRDLDYAAALTLVAAPRVTLVAEMAGRRLSSIGRLVDVVAPHPSLMNVDTQRLSSIERTTTRVAVVGGVKWNAGSSWLLTGNVLRPLTSTGLNTNWTLTAALDYSFGH